MDSNSSSLTGKRLAQESSLKVNTRPNAQSQFETRVYTLDGKEEDLVAVSKTPQDALKAHKYWISRVRLYGSNYKDGKQPVPTTPPTPSQPVDNNAWVAPQKRQAPIQQRARPRVAKGPDPNRTWRVCPPGKTR